MWARNALTAMRPRSHLLIHFLGLLGVVRHLRDDLGLGLARLNSDLLLDFLSVGLDSLLHSGFYALVYQPLKVRPKRLRQMHDFLVKLDDFLMMRTHIFSLLNELNFGL